jgi:hypothetical protein
MAPNRFPPPAAAGFRTTRLIACVSAAAESFWRQHPAGWAAACWVAVAIAISLALYFVPAPMPPAMPAMVQMAVNGDVKAPFPRAARAGNAQAPVSEQHALDASAVGARDEVPHPVVAK